MDGAEVERWWADLEQADQDGTFFFPIVGFIVSGRKPEPETVQTASRTQASKPSQTA